MKTRSTDVIPLISSIATRIQRQNDKRNDFIRSVDMTASPSKKKIFSHVSLTLGALGVVFGDIGTSPLYVLNTVFVDNVNPSREQCLGAVSLILWILIILVTVKYALFILMADNQGEGGTFALCGLLTGDRSRLGHRAKHLVGIVSIFGASLLIGEQRRSMCCSSPMIILS